MPRETQAAGAARRPTDHPLRFLIPADQLPPGFAARVEERGGDPVAPRPAATVVVVRDAEGGPEALLLRRPRRSAFAADAWVFPGGVVDAADADPALAGRVDGRSPAQWAQRLGVEDPAEAMGYVVAAVREAWEETGILLATGGGAGTGLRAAREELLRGRGALLPLLEREGLRLATDGLLYIAHWITPEPETRRYDTRFFLARLPAGAACELHGDELAEARWMRPAEAVEGFGRGDLRLLPPTAHTLRRLTGFASVDAVWAALRDAPVPAYLPRMRAHPDGILIEVTDPGS